MDTIILVVTLCLLLIAAARDIERFEIPQWIVIGLCVVAVLKASASGFFLAQCLLFLLVLALGQQIWLRSGQGIGWGDIKLIAVLLLVFNFWLWYRIVLLAVVSAIVYLCIHQKRQNGEQPQFSSGSERSEKEARVYQMGVVQLAPFVYFAAVLNVLWRI